MPTLNNMDDVYQHFNFNPSTQQREAIESSDGPIYIVAGPGAGKTRVLLFRIIFLILFMGCRPEKIFVATFSNKAAKELDYGIKSLFTEISMYTGDNYDITGMYIGTVHSSCRKLLTDRSFSRNRRRHKLPKFLDELGQYLFIKDRFIKKCLKKLNMTESNFREWLAVSLEKQLYNKHDVTIALIEMFNRFTEECIDSSSFVEVEENDVKQFGILYDLYVKELKVNNSVDYAFLQQAALKNVNSSDSPRFDYVIIDEYQDTNLIQEKLFFSLSKNTGNICVVGDDDQALYRFRGGSVDCFVEFPTRINQYLKLIPKRIDLIDNYRSKKQIVEFCRAYFELTNWSKEDGQGEYRIENKEIKAYNQDSSPAVFKTQLGNYETVATEIANTVKEIVDSGKVNNPNEIAFLFPSLKGKFVQVMKAALEAVGLQVYAPRAGRFLECWEAKAIFGLFALILGIPLQNGYKGRFEKFHNWIGECLTEANKLVARDPSLKHYVEDMSIDLKIRSKDYQILMQLMKERGINVNEPYIPSRMSELLSSLKDISESTKKALIKSSKFLENKNPPQEKNINYVISSVTATDWNLLDLFYRLVGFKAFNKSFQTAQDGTDNESIINLARITLYLSSFMDNTKSIVTGADFFNNRLSNTLYNSFLYGLFLLEESEVEVKDGLFPLGRIPFLTIHQSKGLEFPVVILGGTGKKSVPPQELNLLLEIFQIKMENP